MHIHSRAILYFDMIRRCGSIREAARHLHVASSAVNRQLLQLEEEVGGPLFERLSGGLRLTPTGEIFSRHVLTVLQDQNRLVSELGLLRGVHRGTVQIAAVEGLTADILPTVIAAMRQRHPGITIQVRICGSAQAARAVMEGEADVGIGFAIERSEQLRQCSVARFELGVIAPAGHPIASCKRVDFARCAQYPLIMPSRELSMHGLLQPVVSHHKGALNVCIEVSSVELGKKLAEAGVGLFFQSRIGVEQEQQKGTLVHIPLNTPQAMYSELGVYVRAGRTLPSALDAFLQIVTRLIEERQRSEVTSG
ncbi:LysR family transcriptional regulator [Corticibacter populi]|uniref:LysR family transcriptional regulator n=1 Tax=Corticibacter populi TaxID=1550736 RepID=A0A3M6R0F8_9BURK|nr:LysR family transcriptional regulator [Corticibacter populi]RMX08691.1 LysR family transcriptional regulator [Corticibacter populi]RZS36035.1 DNA-binding transcriptional LysR family regulator [Corticibacter populi]